MTIEEGIRNYQYLDRLAALYGEKGVELHRRQPGFLTGTNIPPSIAIITCVIDALLAAAQGVKSYGLEMGQTLHLIQDAAAIRACKELAQEYLKRAGFDDVSTPVISLHWMGAWPQDDAQCAALVAYGGTLAAIGGAASVTTKSTHEAFGIPTPQVNAEGLRMTRMAIYLARQIRLDDHPEFLAEVDLIKREVRPILDRTLEIGEGDIAVGTVRACAAGIVDIPWSPNRYVKSRVMPARDADGYLRILDPGDMPFDKQVLEIHTERLRARAKREGVPLDRELAVSSVYEISEPLSRLVPGPSEGSKQPAVTP
jgi:methylaspartate mutase epsilon subunit